jgi:cation/acetate symporter
MADVLAYRLNPRPVRAMASLSTPRSAPLHDQRWWAPVAGETAARGYVTYNTAVTGVGILMIVYVVFGGMLATTWVQIIGPFCWMAGTLRCVLVMAHSTSVSATSS